MEEGGGYYCDLGLMLHLEAGRQTVIQSQGTTTPEAMNVFLLSYSCAGTSEGLDYLP